MRNWFISSLMIFGAACVQAQEQERRLIDRILRPNLELQDRAQEKKFLVDGVSVQKKAEVKSFRIPENARSKKYSADRKFSSAEFASHLFRDGDAAAPVSRHTKLAKQAHIDSARTVLAIHASSNSKSVATSEFAGQRPFLGRGKSQKELSKHDTPLTIEQVRELLNKNK